MPTSYGTPEKANREHTFDVSRGSGALGVAHRYGHSIEVRLKDGQPANLRWRSCYYPVSEVFSTWHVSDRWWELPAYSAIATYPLMRGAQRRTYYRVCCRGPASEQVFDLYHNGMTNHWVLDVA